MAGNHGAAVKDDRQYEELRRQGASKEKAARIANAGRQASARGGASPPYEDWTRDDLYRQARKLDIEGRSSMTKSELIAALRGR